MRIFILILMCVLVSEVHAQVVTEDEAAALAIKANLRVRAAAEEAEAQAALKSTGFDLPKTNVSLTYGQYNSHARNDNNFTITQSIPFTAFGSQSAFNRELAAAVSLQKNVVANDVVFQVLQTYHSLAYLKSRRVLLLQQDSIYSGFLKAAEARYHTGESNLLEKATAETELTQIRNDIRQNDADIGILRARLQTLLRMNTLPDIADESLKQLALPDTTAPSANPSIAVARQNVEVAASRQKLEIAKMAPDLLVGYFNQTLIGVADPTDGVLATTSDRFGGIQVGLSLPLWFVPHRARVKSAKLSREAAQLNYENELLELQNEMTAATQRLQKTQNSLDYFRSSALVNADLILHQVQVAFRAGEITYYEYLTGLKNATSIKEKYLFTLNEFNQHIIYIRYLSGTNQ